MKTLLKIWVCLILLILIVPLARLLVWMLGLIFEGVCFPLISGDAIVTGLFVLISIGCLIYLFK